jgi:uncharacterized membrane protein
MLIGQTQAFISVEDSICDNANTDVGVAFSAASPPFTFVFDVDPSGTTTSIDIDGNIVNIFPHSMPLMVGENITLTPTIDPLWVFGSWSSDSNLLSPSPYSEIVSFDVTYSDTIVLNLGSKSAFISGYETICDNENAEVLVSFVYGVAPFTFVYEIDGIAQPAIVTSSNPHIILTQQGGSYTLLSYSDANGTGFINGQAIVTINSAPIANCIANPDSLSVLFPTTNFIDQSIGNIISWQWDFGDNTPNEFIQNPYHTYPQWPPAVYQVSLIVLANNGCSDTTSTTVTVGHPATSIQEQTTNKELLKVTDLLGREKKQTNQPLFYIYDDGTVEKRIVIE